MYHKEQNILIGPRRLFAATVNSFKAISVAESNFVHIDSNILDDVHVGISIQDTCYGIKCKGKFISVMLPGKLRPTNPNRMDLGFLMQAYNQTVAY